MKSTIKFLAIIALAAIIGISMMACDTGSGSGGGGNFTVTINNIHSSYNNVRIRGNDFLIASTTSGDASGQMFDSTILNGSVTTTFEYDRRMEAWGRLIVEIGFSHEPPFTYFESTATFPISQRRIDINANDMVTHDGRRLSDPR